MRKKGLFFAAFLWAVGAAAQGPPPCTPLKIEPLPQPLGWSEPTDHHYYDPGISLDYAGGRYFLNTTIIFPEGSPPYPGLKAASDNGRDFRLIQLNPPNESATLFGKVFYARGWYFSALSWSNCLARSRDGYSWQVLPGICDMDGIIDVTWTGSQFVAVGGFGRVWTSSDGQMWRERAPVPNVYRPLFMGWADAFRLVVSGSEVRGYTEDYETWHVEDAYDGCGPWPGKGNGWYLCGLARSRDGKTWTDQELISKAREEAFSNRDYGSWKHFAGRQFFAFTAWDQTNYSGNPTTQTVVFEVGTTQDGSRWDFRPVPQGRLTGTVRSDVISFAYSSGWDGIRAWLVMSRGPSINPNWGDRDAWSDFFLASTRCADLGDPVVLPGVAHGEGAVGSRWRTELFLHYPGPNVSEALVEWLPFGADNGEPLRRRVFLSTGESVVYRDVLAELFGVEGVGSLRVVSVGPGVVVQARTYNDTGAGSFGQGIAPWRWEEGIGVEEEGWLVGLEEHRSLSSGFRTNVGVQNLWVEPVVVEVVFRDKQGQELGRKRAELGPFGGVQWFRPLAEFGVEDMEETSALVRIVEGNSRVAAYASRVDNRTGDPTTLRATVLPRQDTVPAAPPGP
jgi:hypothetical protein